MNINAIAGSPSAPLEPARARAPLRTGVAALLLATTAVCAAASLPTALAKPATAALPASAAPGALPAAKPVFKPIDVFDLQWASDPQIAPDGRSIAYVRMSMDIKTDRPHGLIWLTGIDGKHTRPLSGAASSSMPRWSPDGARIAYLSAASDGSTQLFMYWADSNVSAPISHFTESPTSLAWSPDGRWLAFTMAVPAERKPLKVELPQAPQGASWADPPKLIDRLVYRIDGEGYLPATFNQLFVIATDGDYDPLDTEIYRVDLADGSMRALTDRRGPDNHPVVSPDGKHIAYLGFDDQRLGYQRTQLYVMDTDGSHSRSLSAAFDRDVGEPQWSGDGKRIFCEYGDRGTTKLATMDMSGTVRTLAGDMGGADVTRPYTGGSFTVARNGRFAYMQASPVAPAALATGTDTRDISTLTALSANLLAQRTLGTVEEITFDSSADGRKIQGWIVKPPHFDAARKHPLVLEIHGGPFAAYGASFAAEQQLYAAAGYVVLYVNPRGSTGYGEEFGNLIHHDYPDKDFDDLMSGVDAVLGKGYVDPSRLFVTGGSGGGVLTAWIVGHTDRFRAAVVVKPVINWTSFVLTADLTNYFYRYWFASFPWDDEQAYWKHSPLAYVGNVRTPTMLMTGEADYRTPSGEAEQFYEALKLRRVDTALVRVPHASHDISSRPSLLIAKVAYVLGWFAAHDARAPHEETAAHAGEGGPFGVGR